MIEKLTLNKEMIANLQKINEIAKEMIFERIIKIMPHIFLCGVESLVIIFVLLLIKT